MDRKIGVVSLIKTSNINYIHFNGGYSTSKFIPRGSDKRKSTETGYKI